jgi:hypothetical protein
VESNRWKGRHRVVGMNGPLVPGPFIAHETTRLQGTRCRTHGNTNSLQRFQTDLLSIAVELLDGPRFAL